MLMLERVGKSVDFPAEKFDILPTQGKLYTGGEVP
jgi:hypothetical protein